MAENGVRIAVVLMMLSAGFLVVAPVVAAEDPASAQGECHLNECIPFCPGIEYYQQYGAFAYANACVFGE